GGGRAPTGDHGMVTAELAVALPALVLVISLLLAVVGVASDVSRAAEAARSAARGASIGTDISLVTEQAQQLAPPGATVRIWTDGPWVRVEVVAPARRWGPLTLPAARSTGAALLEPGLTP
ncbi:MAG: pilus assembly protein TadE, partial [Actinomycetia bacterium]|nr:pilus assembly protein TadE [Actinomycetes bacterium]